MNDLLASMTVREEARQSEKQNLARLLKIHGGNIAAVSKEMGYTRTAIIWKLRKYGLYKPLRRA